MRLLLAPLAFALAGQTACKYDLDQAPPPVFCTVKTAAVCVEAEDHSDFAWLQANMFSTNCSGKDCHGAPVAGKAPLGKLVLAEGFAYKTLLGMEPTDPGPPPLVASELTKRHKLVQPGEPKASYLY